MTELMPGAEPWSAAGGPAGALCLHGFTGNPTSMRPVAKAFADAGFAVELPRLPGHGTTVDDMITTGWGDWTAAAEAAYESLSARCERVVVGGLSMGGSLTLWLAARHPEIAGIVCVNPAVVPQPPEVIDMVEGMLAEGAGPHARHRVRHRRPRRRRERLRRHAARAVAVADGRGWPSSSRTWAASRARCC